MNFPFVVVAILLACLTITCNGQFKILGLLDTKSELNNGKVENIRSLVDDVGEPLSVDSIENSATINDSESFDDSAKGNVNFIKSLDASIANKNEGKSDLVEVTKIPGNTTTKDALVTDESSGENVFGEDDFDEYNSEDNSASILESSTARSTTTKTTRAYRSECNC